MNLQEILSRLYDDRGRPLSKRQVREILYRDRVNVIAEVDRQLCEAMFGIGTPFRILPSSEVIDGAERNIATLTRAVDVYNYLCDQPQASIRNLIEKMRSFDVKDIYARRDEWKALNKEYRNADLSWPEQLALSFCRSFYTVITADVSTKFLEDYIKEYGNDEPCKEYINDDVDQMISDQFVRYYTARFKDLEKMKHVPKPCKNKASSMCRRKYYDWKYVLNQIDKIVAIDPDAKRALLLCLEGISLIYLVDLSETIQKVESIPSDPESIDLLEFLPNGMVVAQCKGKVGRFVCCGNDLYDLVLQPLMDVIQKFESVLPCFAPNKLKEMSNADLNKSVADSWKNMNIQLTPACGIKFQSSCCGADSSNATEKLNGSYMFRSWRIDYESLPEEIKDKFSLPERYLDICEELLTKLPFHIMNDGHDYIMFTNGTSQGLMVSWDCLNYGNMKIIARAFFNFGIEDGYSEKESSILALKGTLRCSTDGDDGEFPLDIRPFYVRRLKELSLPGVINEDKSHDEAEVGYVEYISSYIRSGYKTPNILSNLRIISLITDLTDGFKIKALLESKIMRQQIQLLKPTLELFKTIYNRRNLPYLLDSPELIQRDCDYSIASDRVRFANLADLINRIDHHDLVPKEGTDYAPVPELSPCKRALRVFIDNMNMSFSQAYILASEKALSQCYDIESRISDIDQELLDIRQLLLEGCQLSDIDTTLSGTDMQILEMSMLHVGLKGMPRSFFVNREVLEKNFEVEFRGFTEGFIISCHMRTIKED